MKVLANNKGVRRNYEILKTVEAGIKLKGYEVKSARQGSISLKESYIRIKNLEAYIVGMHIGRWQYTSDKFVINPIRDRKLLLNKGEIERIELERKRTGGTIVPLKVYINKNRIKVEIALVKGLRKYEKREKIRKKEFEREVRQRTKNATV